MRLAVLALLAACATPPDPPPLSTPPTAPVVAPPAPPPAAPVAADPGWPARRAAHHLRRLRNLLGEAAERPVTGLAEADVRAGRVAFRATCQVCHGLHGRGDGPAAGALRPPPADLADPQLTEGRTDALLWATIRLGVPDTAMVGFADQVEEPELLAIAAWVRTLPAGGT